MELAIIGVLVLLVIAQQVALVYQSHDHDRRLVRLLDLNRADREEILARVSTSPRLEMAPRAQEPEIDPHAVRYIPDTPDGDDHWNDFRRVAEDER